MLVLLSSGLPALCPLGQRWMLETRSEGTQYFAGQVDAVTCSCTTVVEYFYNHDGCLIGDGFVFLRSTNSLSFGAKVDIGDRTEGAQCFAGQVDAVTCSCTTVVEYFYNHDGCLIGDGFVFLRSTNSLSFGAKVDIGDRTEGAQCFAGPVDGCHLLLYSSSEVPLSFTTIIKMDA